MAQVIGFTPTEDTTEIYPVIGEYIIEKPSLMSNETQQISGKVDGIEHTEWTLKMVKTTPNPHFYWSIYLEVTTKIPLKCEVSFEIASENDSIFHHCRDIVDGSKTIGKSPFLTYTDVSSKFRNDDKLFLRFKAAFSYITKEDQRIYGATKLIQNNEWSKRLQNHGQKDVKLIVGDESVEIHKFFLTAESSVFTAMLENQKYKETQTGEVVITDFKMNNVKAIVAFCYGENIANFIKFTENAIELLMFADKYDMKNLKASFEEYYSKKLTKANVPNVLAAANKFNAAILKAKCINFINALSRIEKAAIVVGALDEELRELFAEDN